MFLLMKFEKKNEIKTQKLLFLASRWRWPMIRIQIHETLTIVKKFIKLDTVRDEKMRFKSDDLVR